MSQDFDESSFLAQMQDTVIETPTDLSTEEDFSLGESIDPVQREINKNQAIIDAANKLIKTRIEYDDDLRLSDVISAKSEAFKQIRILEGNNDDFDTSKLIPAVINIQINNR